ncbi:MAG: iron ABC transporter permease [Candidatus Hydrogenedentes bacterium]|nr:iron ABC transporter permease [Candidatus Hydrogenedentota bacterium]
MNTASAITRWILWTGAITGIVLVLSPVFIMVWDSFIVQGEFTTASYHDVLRFERQWLLLRNSLALAGICTIASVVIGFPLAFLLVRTAVPAKPLLAFCFAIPLVVPPYIFAMIWGQLLGTQGLVTGMLKEGFSLTEAPYTVHGLAGSAWVLTLCYYPIIMLTTAAALLSANAAHEEAGRLFVGWRRALVGITLRQCLPGTLIGALLVFILSLGNFGVPSLLQFHVYALEVYTKFNAFYDMQGATAAAMPLLVFSLVALFLLKHIQRRHWSVSLSSHRRPLAPLPLGRWRWGVFLLALAVIGISVLLPVAALIQESGSGHAYYLALKTGWPELLQSVLIASIAATAVVFLGFWMGYVSARGNAWPAAFLDWGTVAAFAIPGTVLGIGLIKLWNRTGWPGLVYGSIAIVVLAWISRFIVFAQQGAAFAVRRIDPRLEEAAAISGVSWPRTIMHVVLPLLWPFLAALWLLTFMFCLGELSTSVLVSPAGVTTVTVRLFTLMHYGMNELVAAMSVILLAFLLVPLGLFCVVIRKSSGFGHA